MSATNQRVIIGLSGGVDSAVAALLLKRQGYEVTALFMKNWEEDDHHEYCAAAADLADAEAICAHLGIELRRVNFAHEYWERVFSSFLHEYEAGRTPNPDVLCNREIKFKEFLTYAQTLGADRIATGHYAGIMRDAHRCRLLRATDRDKDQSYFLHTLDQNALANTLFPLAQMSKQTVRRMARESGLPVHDKKDSTGICFIGERRFKDFLSAYVRPARGDIRDLEQRTLGVHDGLCYYTIGQRQGLGIGGPGEAWYVVAKDMVTGVLYVAQGHDHPALQSGWLHAQRPWWIADAPRLPFRCTAKTRYRQVDQDCRVESHGDDAIRVTFDTVQRAVTPGQSVVFYSGDECLGGCVITHCEALDGVVHRPAAGSGMPSGRAPPRPGVVSG